MLGHLHIGGSSCTLDEATEFNRLFAAGVILCWNSRVAMRTSTCTAGHVPAVLSRSAVESSVNGVDMPQILQVRSTPSDLTTVRGV